VTVIRHIEIYQMAHNPTTSSQNPTASPEMLAKIFVKNLNRLKKPDVRRYIPYCVPIQAKL
jgi:hypothetical protein